MTGTRPRHRRRVSLLVACVAGMVGCGSGAFAQDACRSAYDMGMSLASQGVLRPHQIAENFFRMASDNNCGLAFLDGQQGNPYIGGGNPAPPTPVPPYIPPAPTPPPTQTANQIYLRMVGLCNRWESAARCAPGSNPYDVSQTCPNAASIAALQQQCCATKQQYMAAGGGNFQTAACQ
jgi:hypothetical protein